jgi:ribosomal protein S12 methylthiotransferase
MAEPYGAWVRLHYVYPYPHVDEIIPLMASGKRAALPGRAVPAQPPRRAAPDEAAGQRREEPRAHPGAGASLPELVVRSTFIAGFPGETEAEFQHLLDFVREAQIDRAGCFAYSPVEGAAANDIPGMLPQEVREERRARFMAVAEEVSAEPAAAARRRHDAGAGGFGAGLGRKGGVGRSYADAPEIDGTVRLLPPEKISKQLRWASSRGAHRGHRGPRPGGAADLIAHRRRQKPPAETGGSIGKQKAGGAGFLSCTWCPGEDSNLHDVTR